MPTIVDTDDPLKFLDAIEEWENLTFKNINYLIKVVSLDLFSQVIADTPVRTGRAQNNWVFSYGKTPKYTQVGPWDYEGLKGATFDKSKDGKEARTKVQNGIRRAPAMIKEKTGVIEYYLTNQVPYIRKLEYGGYPQGDNSTNATISGYSSQAVGGMARKNVQKFANYNFTKIGKRKGKI